jgi:hypothetical protein
MSERDRRTIAVLSLLSIRSPRARAAGCSKAASRPRATIYGGGEATDIGRNSKSALMERHGTSPEG